jgi:type II secretory pathway component PulC
MNKQPHSGSRLGQFILLLICCGLGYLLWEETNRHAYNFADTINNTKAEAVQKPINTEDETQIPPLSSFNEITDRPLFFENREPFVYLEPEEEDKIPKKTVNKPTVKKQQQKFMLNAVIITADQRIAIIQSGRGRDLHTISMGESIEGWTLDEVEYGSVKLTNDGETQYLELEVKGSTNKITPPPRTSKQPPRRTGKQKGETTNQQQQKQTQIDINEQISDPVRKLMEEEAARTK